MGQRASTIPDEYPDEYRDCRDFGHIKMRKHLKTTVSNGLVLQEFKCPRCKTIIRRFLLGNGTFERTSRYKHPKDYLLRGQGRIAPAEFRALGLRALRQARRVR